MMFQAWKVVKQPTVRTSTVRTSTVASRVADRQ
jgi:hypothetical protein